MENGQTVSGLGAEWGWIGSRLGVDSGQTGGRVGADWGGLQVDWGQSVTPK